MIAALVARIEALTAANALLVARIAELGSKLDQPPRTPERAAVEGERPPNPRSLSRGPSRIQGHIAHFSPAAAKAAGRMCSRFPKARASG
jgi:hypothetical protein